MCFEKLKAKQLVMKRLKEILDQIATGVKNKLDLDGSFAGNYQMAVIILKCK